MTRVAINTGATPNDGTGDNLRAAGGIINNNFLELYTYLGAGSTNILSAPIWNTTASGINTSRNVGLGTTNPRFSLEVGSVGASGTSLWVNGDARITGILTIGTSSITLNGSSNTINVGSGITINGNTGIISATQIYVGGVQVGSVSAGGTWAVTSVGIHTLKNVGIGTTNPTSALTVKGNTSLETLSVSGITTSSGFNGNLSGTASTVTTSNQNYLRLGSPFNIYSPSDELFSVITDRNLNNKKILIDYAGNMYFGSKVGGSLDTGGFADAAMIITPGNEGGPYSSIQLDGHISAGGTIGGSTIFTNQLSVSGVSTFTGASIFNDYLALGGGSAFIDYSSFNVVFTQPTGTDGSDDVGGFKFITTNPGLPSSQETSLSLYSAGSYWDRLVRIHRNLQVDNNITVNGTSTFAGITTVTGTTLFANQLNVSGISTLNSNVSVGGTISVDGGVKLATNNATIVGTSGTAGEIKQIAGAPFYYDGSAWREFVLSSGTPVTVPADTEWDNVVFRATFDDDFTDAKFGATPVYIGAGSSIVGAAVTIGTGSLRLDGVAGAGISYAYRSDYDFTGSWTIEFWMYVDSGPSSNNPAQPVSLVSMNSTTGIGTSGNWSLAMYGDQFANKYITWFNQNNPSYRFGTSLYYESGAAWSLTILDKWNHFALVREGDNGSLHFYVNGIERSQTINDAIIDNDILDISSNGLHFGGDNTFTIGSLTFNSTASADVIFDDVRISCGVGTAGQRYNSIGAATTVFTPPTTALPTTGTLSSYVQPPGDKYGEIGLGTSPTWRGTSGVTVSQQSSGNYRVSFASSYTNANDYFVLTQPMDQGFASYVGIARSTTHVDLAINKQSDDTAVDTGSLSVQIKNHI